MMYKYRGVRPITVTSFDGVRYQGKASLSLPCGDTYDYLFLRSNLPAARLSFKARLNGKVFYEAPMTVFDMLDAYKELNQQQNTAQNGYVYVIPFADLSMRLKDGQNLTGLVTQVGESFDIEVTIAAKASGDPETPQLSAHPLLGLPRAQRIFLPRLEVANIPTPATGTNQFSSLPNVPNRTVRRMHFATDKIDRIDIKRDDDEAYSTDCFLEKFRAKRNKRTWQNGWTHLDFIMRGYIQNEMFPTVRDKQLIFTLNTTAATGSIDVYIEYLDCEKPELLTQGG
ncbi:TPA: major capsid protein P2 [Vibrio vulnificus]